MRDRWRLFVAVMIVSLAGALAVVASSQAAITITSVQVEAGGANVASATGPMGAGYDIRVVANVSSDDTWRATRWTSGGVSYCIDHGNVGSGTGQSVTLPYAFQKGLLRETPLPQNLPPGAGNAEHVFPPPPGPSQLTVAVYNTNDCSGSPSSTQSITLTTTAPAANPPLIAACQELNVAVVLDESGSIASAGATQKVRDATKALAQGLVGTGASMAAFKFSTTRNSSTIAPYQTVTQAFVNGTGPNQLTGYLNNYNPSGYTNWDDGLLQVEQATASNKPDLIIFLTDGNPNRYGTSGSVTGIQEGEYRAMRPAVDVADRLKQAGSHMFVIGMGDGVTDPLSALRLQAVSGGRSFPTYPISIADYTLVTNFDELAAALAQLASNLCNVTVTVTKETDEQTRDAWISKAGWGFSGRVVMQPPADPFAYAWFKPNAAGPPVNTTTATQSGNTGTNGTLEFAWRPTSAASLSNITISESVPPNFTAESVKCVSAGTTILDSVDSATVASFTLTGLKVRDKVDCLVRNQLKRSTVRVVKNWVGDPASATIFVDADGTAPYDASTVAPANGHSASFMYPLSTRVTVGETTVPAGYSATIDCGGGPQPYGGGPFPVTSPATPDTTLTCTITNTKQQSTVRVVKNWVGTPASTTIFVDRDGASPFDASTVAAADGDNVSYTYPVSTPVTVGETLPVPPGYTRTIQCGAGAAQPYAGGPFAVTSPATGGDTLTCTINNALIPPPPVSTVRVIKDWVGAPGSATIFVDADGTAPYDVSAVATTSGASVSFDYAPGTPVTVGEATVPSGYTATIDCGEGPQAYGGGPFPVASPTTPDTTLTCTITNTQQRSTVQVVKNWVGTPASTTIFVDADGTVPYDASAVATASGQGVSFTYPVSTPVFLGETTVPTGFRATIDCGGGPQPYAGGPFPVTSPAEDAATLTCTITNTPRTTVRLIKNWAGRRSSATIFVDAVGQSPYDVSAVAEVDGESVSFDYAPSKQISLGEVTVPSGYRAFIDCGGGLQNLRRYSGGPFFVTSPSAPGGLLTCTLWNARVPLPGRLVIVKTSSRRVIRSPRQFEFRFAVRNTGRGVARAVRVCDALPKGLVLVRGYGARLERGALCWHITRLRPGARKKLRVRVRPTKTNRPIVIVNIGEVAGVNTPNCPRIAIARRAQRPGCTGRARVRILAARVLEPPKRRPKPPFTG